MDHSAHTTFFTQAEFMPHGHCYLWKPALVWTHVFSDLLIGLAYLSISLVLYALVRKIRLPFSPVFIAFGAFIGACGLTHFMEIWNLWNADYWAGGAVKVITAIASVVTAAALFPIRPKVVALAEAARVSEERKAKLEAAHLELGALYEKVKESDQLKTQFFANVSHELRTPLSLILGPIGEVLKDPELGERQRQRLEVVSRNAKTLLKQVNDLLDISKLEAGRLTPRYVRTDLVKLFRLVAAHFETLMQAKSIFFSIETPDSITAEVDADKVQRVFMNFLSNAVKFVPNGGRIRIVMKEEGERFVFRIEDTGPGVDPEFRQSLFERFRQGEGGVNRRVGGTGLGLAIIKDFVEMHHGSVRLQDGHAPGATFVVELPLRAPADVGVSAETEVSGESSRVVLEGTVAELRSASMEGVEEVAAKPGLATVLVCEDNPDMNRFVFETLASDFNVIRAVDGAEGLAKARQHRPDLIVSDIMMPHVSGDQLVRQLKRDQEMADTPVLLLSARSDDEMRIRLLAEGASDYLVKPFAPEELRARSRNLLSMKRVRDVLNDELATKSRDVVGLVKELAVKRHEAEAASEMARVARDEAERVSQLKSSFLGLISHELNTPFSAINLAVQMLRRRDLEKLEPWQRELVERLSSSAKQMKALIEGLLEYVRAGGENQRRTRERCDLKALSHEAIDSLNLLAIQKGLELRTKFPAEDCTFLSDTMKLRVILNNLVMNAVKFTNEGFVEVELRCEKDRRVLIVRDSGPGIPVADQKRIFDPFERLEPLMQKATPGVGLGLALVRQIVKSLDGRIHVESDGKNGSAFIVDLPLEAPVV